MEDTKQPYIDVGEVPVGKTLSLQFNWPVEIEVRFSGGSSARVSLAPQQPFHIVNGGDILSIVYTVIEALGDKPDLQVVKKTDE